MKNPYGKTAPVSAPHITISVDGWTYKILRLYNSPAAILKSPQYKRALCCVTSADNIKGDLGDTYITDIPGLLDILAKVVASQERSPS